MAYHFLCQLLARQHISLSNLLKTIIRLVGDQKPSSKHVHSRLAFLNDVEMSVDEVVKLPSSSQMVKTTRAWTENELSDVFARKELAG
jgi:hypothetical protein